MHTHERELGATNGGTVPPSPTQSLCDDWTYWYQLGSATPELRLPMKDLSRWLLLTRWLIFSLHPRYRNCVGFGCSLATACGTLVCFVSCCNCCCGLRRRCCSINRSNVGINECPLSGSGEVTGCPYICAYQSIARLPFCCGQQRALSCS